MSTVLLTTKLTIPPAPPGIVSRPRLAARLEEGQHQKLTLVAAPAGFGKTTLIADWVRHQTAAMPVAWFSLDDADNDPAQFMAYLVAALQTAVPTVGQTAASLLQSLLERPNTTPQSETAALTALLSQLFTQLINDLAAQAAPMILVLDDYHVIQNELIHEALLFFVERLPSSCRLFITSRTEPPWPLARLRVKGSLAEIRAEDLRFSADETAAFLNETMGLSLAAADVAALETRTEGWVAALQMAALSLNGRHAQTHHSFITSFAGSHRYLVDYLLDEVFSQQPPATQTFLLKTAVLNRLTGPLCDALLQEASTGSGDADPAASGQQILVALESANLFLTPLDEERKWYRYHHLFAEFLLHRLQQEQSVLVPELHRRASFWFEQAGLVDEAFRHAQQAQDMARAAQLLDRVGVHFLRQGAVNRILRWLEMLPEAQREAYPRLYIYQALVVCINYHLEDVEPLLQKAEANQQRLPEPAIAAYAAVVRADLYFARGLVHGFSHAQAVKQIQQALDYLDRSPDDEVTRFFRGHILMTRADVFTARGDLPNAERAFQESIHFNQAAGNEILHLASFWKYGDLKIAQGQLHRGEVLHQQGLRLAEASDQTVGHVRAPILALNYFHLRLAQLYYEWNRLSEAEEHAQQAVALFELRGLWDRFGAYGVMARIKWVLGEREAALDWLQRLDALHNTAPNSHIGHLSKLTSINTSLLLAQSDPALAYLRKPAFEWLQQHEHLLAALDLSQQRRLENLVLVEVLMVNGRLQEALQHAKKILERINKTGFEGHRPQILATQVLILAEQGQTQQALDLLQYALEIAEPEGYVRSFVDQGVPMQALLRQLPINSYRQRLLAAFDPDLMATTEPGIVPVLPEPLTERELEVLRLLVSGLKNKEMAESLVVSVNTIRFHLKNLYSKLHVDGRTEAIAKAHTLGLLNQ
ncbi:MAG: hypothetical protein CL608_32895 [Anaerolineaceae bacterium]|nr:hypothetical protein [Anaerolineaceae bacterium]